MFMELYKFSKVVMHLNSCSIDLGRDINGLMEDVGLTCFGFIGIVITWPNKRIGDQNIKEHLDKIVVNIVRRTHVPLPSITQPFVPFFLISSGDEIWLYKYEANFISNIWVRALCASTICVYLWIYVCNCTNTYAC